MGNREKRQRTIKKVFNFQPTVNYPSKTELQRDEKESIFCHLRSLWRKTFVCVCQLFQKICFGSKIFTPVQIWTGKQIIFLVILCNSIMCKMCVQSNPVSILQVLSIRCQKSSAKHGKILEQTYFSLEIPSACINAVLRVKKTEKKFRIFSQNYGPAQVYKIIHGIRPNPILKPLEN